MASSGANREFKSGSSPLDTGQPVAAERAADGSADQHTIAERAVTTKILSRTPHESSLKLSQSLVPLLPHLGSNGLACLLRVSIVVNPRTQK